MCSVANSNNYKETKVQLVTLYQSFHVISVQMVVTKSSKLGSEMDIVQLHKLTSNLVIAISRKPTS